MCLSSSDFNRAKDRFLCPSSVRPDRPAIMAVRELEAMIELAVYENLPLITANTATGTASQGGRKR